MVIVNGLLYAELTDLLIGIPVSQISWIIQVIAVLVCHGQNLAVIGIHDNGCAHLASCGILPLVQIFLHDFLDIYIDGRNHCISIFSWLDHTFQVGLLIQVSVFPAVCADELVIIILFDTAVSVASVALCKSDYIAGQGIVRINPFVLILKPYTLYLFPGIGLSICLVHLGLQFLKSCLFVIRKPSGIPDIVGLRPFQYQIPDFIGIIPECLA